VGIGLLGGSLGMAMRRRGAQVVGFDVRSEVVGRAIARGAIDSGGTDPAIVSSADLVILATPLDQLAKVAADLAGLFRPGCLITDVGSVKAPIVSKMEALLPRKVRYVGGHPMFGTSAEGIEAADGSLVAGSTFVLTPTERTDAAAVEELMQWAAGLEMRPHRLSPQEHDDQIASLSHLPYLIALSLVASVDDVQAAGPAFQEMTRVAMSPPALWRSILQENHAAISASLERFEAELARLWALEGDPLRQALDHLQAKRLAMFPQSKR
jgi:prephenate dehydrogenase